MDRISSRGLDTALAEFLMNPSSAESLRMVRSARRLMFKADLSGNVEMEKRSREHLKDCMMLHGVVLTLESDPEIVRRNITARVISGVFPLLNAFEEIRSLEDRTLYELFISSLGIISEVATATQYLEGTRLSATAHTERALMEVEDRLVELLMEKGGGGEEDLDRVERLIDDLRKADIPPREKAFIPFLLWCLITVISYRNLKELF